MQQLALRVDAPGERPRDKARADGKFVRADKIRHAAVGDGHHIGRREVGIGRLELRQRVVGHARHDAAVREVHVADERGDGRGEVRLVPRRLELDVQPDVGVPGKSDGRLERRDARVGEFRPEPAAAVEVADVGVVQLPDVLFQPCCAAHGGVVLDDEHAVARLLDVELDAVRAELDGALKGIERVFRVVQRRGAP